MLNKVILIGNLGADAETLNFENGSLVKASLATSENYKNRNDEWQSKTEWHNLIFNNKLSERAAQLKKGQRLYVEGKIETRKYTDKTEQEKRVVNIKVFTLRTLDKAVTVEKAGDNRRVKFVNNSAEKSTHDSDLPF